MAREKGTGSLQLEKSGRWTMRVGIKGKRYSRSTRTTDREKAEKFLERFLSPLGLGSRRLPLADVWLEYVKSPDSAFVPRSARQPTTPASASCGRFFMFLQQRPGSLTTLGKGCGSTQTTATADAS